MPNVGAGQGQNTNAGPSPQQINAAQRAQVLSQAVTMTQSVFNQNVGSAGAGTPVTVNIVPRNVGLIKKFVIEVSGTINNTDSADSVNLTDFGFANFFSQISFVDLNNNTRIQTAGWHLYSLWTAKHKWGYGDLAAMLDSGSNGSVMAGQATDNFHCVIAPGSVAHGTPTAFRFFLEVPLAYSDDDLRGSVYANVVNAVMNLQLIINPNAFAAPATDSTLAVYKGATGYTSTTSNFSNVVINVYQTYLDQLPIGKQGVVLPYLDLSTIYELKNTLVPAIVGNQDNPYPFANFRDFLSTFMVYNHDPSADAGRVGGGDINYWALQSANFTNIWKKDPYYAALSSRKLSNLDWPNGMYYFSSRRKPISTTQYGNMEMILNPSSAAAGAYILVGVEDFALVNTLTQAGSLAG